MERLWLNGRIDEARDRVPLELARQSNLLGTDATVKDRLRAYRDAGIDALRVGLRGDTNGARLEQLTHLLALVAEVDTEPRETVAG